MSNSFLCQMWHTVKIDNKELCEIIVYILRKDHGLAKKDVASQLYVRTSRVHNWFHKKTGMTAFDLLMLMWRYSYIQQNIQELMRLPFDEFVSRNQQLSTSKGRSIDDHLKAMQTALPAVDILRLRRYLFFSQRKGDRFGMILGFACKRTEELFRTGKTRHFQAIAKKALRKLDQIQVAGELADLAVPPGNRLEALMGDRAGQHSIRINEQWRVCFVWQDGHATQVAIVDYH